MSPSPTAIQSGIFNIDKPVGLTSREVVDQVLDRYPRVKAGHGGTLDRAARGVLPVLVNEATKLVPYLQEERKSYRTTVRFDRISPSYDMDRQHRPVDPGTAPSRSRLNDVLSEFQGDIEQRPPDYSALRTDGQRAYEKIERGEEVNLRARTVTVYDLNLLEMDYPELTFTVTCGKGFYVRALVRDLGARLQKEGAVVSDLVREQYGPFSRAEAVDLEESDWSRGWFPPRKAIENKIVVRPDAEEITIVCNGGWIPRSHEGEEIAAMVDSDRRLRAMVESTVKNNRPAWQPRRVLNIAERNSR